MTYNTDRRRPLSQKQRPIFLLAHGCICHWCSQPITDDEWDDDHIVPKELMPPGSDWNALSNRAPIHRTPCHKQKTARDIAMIRKSDRIRRANGLVPDKRKPRPRMRSRGFQKKLRRKFNGKVEAR